MSKTLIYIGDDALDLDPSTVIGITVQAVNVGDLKTRNVSYTNQFKVPATENNCRALGYTNVEQSRSSIPYRFNTCKVVQNGIETLKGVLQVIRYQKGHFSISIFEDLFDIFKFLDGKKIKDIDPIPASAWDNFAMDDARTNTSGLISAILQWGHSATDIFEADFFMPCFYYHTFIRAILGATGLSLSGNILSDARFTDLVIPFPGDIYAESSSGSPSVPEYVAKGTKDEDNGLSVDPTFMGSINAGDLLFIQAINVQSPTVVGIDTPSGWTRVSEETFAWGTAALYYKVATGSESGTINVSRTGSSGTPGDYMMAQIYQYKDTSGTITIDDTDDNSGTSTPITWRILTLTGAHRTGLAFFVDYNGTSVSAPTGYSDGTAVDSSSLISGVNIGVFTNEDENSLPQVTTPTSTVDGWAAWHIAIYGSSATVLTEWNDLWPDIEVKDILRDFFVRFGIIAKQKNQTIYLKTIEEIITDRMGAIDWTSKLTKTDKPIDFGSRYAQANYFEYNNQTNDETLARGTLEIDNETLDPIGTIYSSVFQTVDTDEFEFFNIYKSAIVPIYDDTSTDNTDIKESPAFTLLTLRARDAVYDPAITFAVTPRTDYKVAYFIDTDQDKDSNFQFFLDQFYPKYEEALQKTKVIEKEYLLTEEDIYNYDSHKMIYDGEGYYIINKIKNFRPNMITVVELFKVG